MVVIGIVCTVALGALISIQQPVYLSRTEVYFLAPSSSIYPNVLRTTSLDIVVTAGAVRRRVVGNAGQIKTASPDVTLIGLRDFNGTSIVLPDNGGQWQSNYNSQVLVVQTTGSSPEDVLARQSASIDRIGAELTRLQDEQDVPANTRITLLAKPDPPSAIAYSGERRRAELMTAILGVLLTLAAVVAVERRSARRGAAVGGSPRGDTDPRIQGAFQATNSSRAAAL